MVSDSEYVGSILEKYSIGKDAADRVRAHYDFLKESSEENKDYRREFEEDVAVGLAYDFGLMAHLDEVSSQRRKVLVDEALAKNPIAEIHESRSALHPRNRDFHRGHWKCYYGNK